MVENELHFLRWTEFKRMAPSVLQLEIARMSKLINAQPVDTEFRNALVKARFELKRFAQCLETAERASVGEACASHLRTALLALTIDDAELDEETARARVYILDRLTYVYDQIEFVY